MNFKMSEQHKQRFQEVKKPMYKMLIILGILFGGIFLYKAFVGLMMKNFFASHENPPQTVSTTIAKNASWEDEFSAVGSLRATLGVNVTAQLGGMIQKIYFTPGAVVQEGTLLVQQNADPDIAQLHSLEANAELAKITYERDSAQYKIKAVSKQQVDTDEQNLKSYRAQVAQQAAIVDKLTIVAPFTGKLGISNVNPGQFLNPGDNIVSLQSLDPIYVDFYLPQQALASLKVGQQVTLTIDTFPDKKFVGKVTTIEPAVDVSTRNVEVEATIPNPLYELSPGMFANVQVKTGNNQTYLTLPQTAVTFNPYGDVVYTVKEKGKDKDGKPILIANQVFVTTGKARGNQVSIMQGLKAGDEVVSSGQLKLKNGTPILINNAIQPSDAASISLPNEHGS